MACDSNGRTPRARSPSNPSVSRSICRNRVTARIGNVGGRTGRFEPVPGVSRGRFGRVPGRFSRVVDRSRGGNGRVRVGRGAQW
jgi:hypothetical protein